MLDLWRPTVTTQEPGGPALDLDALELKAKAATKGPRGWFGNLSHKHIYLATRNNGRQYIMGFRRWGMQGAQPLFRKQFTSVTGKPAVIMTDASELAVKEADYRDDIARIDNPDAEFIAACDPDTVLELIRLARAAASLLGEDAE